MGYLDSAMHRVEAASMRVHLIIISVGQATRAQQHRCVCVGGAQASPQTDREWRRDDFYSKLHKTSWDSAVRIWTLTQAASVSRPPAIRQTRPKQSSFCSLTLQSRSVARSREHISDKPEIHRGGGGGGGGGGAAQPRTHADARSLVVRRFSSFMQGCRLHTFTCQSLQVRRATGQESASAKLVQALAPSVHFTEHGHAQFRWRASSAARKENASTVER